MPWLRVSFEPGPVLEKCCSSDRCQQTGYDAHVCSFKEGHCQPWRDRENFVQVFGDHLRFRNDVPFSFKDRDPADGETSFN